MSRLNWIGFVMLTVAFLFPVSFPGEMELLLGIDMWNHRLYDMNMGVVFAAAAYLLVGASLMVWSNTRDEQD